MCKESPFSHQIRADVIERTHLVLSIDYENHNKIIRQYEISFSNLKLISSVARVELFSLGGHRMANNWIDESIERIEYYEVDLPEYLQHDLDEMIKGEEPYDCLWCELYGSINSAFWDDVITEEHAAYLRARYLGI